MRSSPLLIPLFAQVFLTFTLMLLMAVKRVRGAKEKRYKVRDIALDSKKYPDEIIKFGNSFSNQFELPMLFYLLCVLMMMAKETFNSFWIVVLAYLFVAARAIHAYIHVTSNNVIARFYAFSFSAIILMIMWAHFAASMLF